jgi:hypothetical protein
LSVFVANAAANYGKISNKFVANRAFLCYNGRISDAAAHPWGAIAKYAETVSKTALLRI